jgi:hypothetical protein
MTQITLKIKDSKVDFFMELIKNFDFIKVEEHEMMEPTKEEILENIKHGYAETQLIQQGKLKATPINDFLDELQS